MIRKKSSVSWLKLEHKFQSQWSLNVLYTPTIIVIFLTNIVIIICLHWQASSEATTYYRYECVNTPFIT